MPTENEKQTSEPSTEPVKDVEDNTCTENVEEVKKEVKKEELKEKKPELPQQKPAVHKPDYETDVVYVYQFPRTPTIPSLSPFCLKVETWLRIAGIKFENVDHKNKYRSKKGQLPFVEVNGEEIADSAIIIKELLKRYNHDMDSFLTPEQRILSHTTISMIENHLFWASTVAWRTKNGAAFLKASKVDLQKFSGYERMPAGLLKLLAKLKLKQSAKKVKAHGLGVHSPEEIEEFGQQDLQTLSDILKDKDYYFGDQPALLDVIAFAFLAQLRFMDKDTPYPLRDWMMEKTPNLVAHIDRIKEKFFGDWDEMISTLDMNSHLPKPLPEKEPEKEEPEKAEKEETEKEKEAEEVKEEEKTEKTEVKE